MDRPVVGGPWHGWVTGYGLIWLKRCPVGQCGAGAAAAAKLRPGAGEPLGEGAALVDVFVRDPDRVAAGHGGAVVTPAGPRRVADERLVAGEPVGHALALGRDPDRSRTRLEVQAGVGRARIVVGADQGERDDGPPCVGDPDAAATTPTGPAGPRSPRRPAPAAPTRPG